MPLQSQAHQGQMPPGQVPHSQPSTGHAPQQSPLPQNQEAPQRIPVPQPTQAEQEQEREARKAEAKRLHEEHEIGRAHV